MKADRAVTSLLTAGIIFDFIIPVHYNKYCKLEAL